MIPQALRIIQEEHQALSAMLLSLSMLVRRAHQDKKPPPFDVLRAMPRDTERAPFQRVRPALPITSLMWSGLETAPTDPMQLASAMRVSPDLSLSSTKPWSRPATMA